MGISVLGIGITGLNAATAGLATTGHNIANASTPGFSRQEIVQSSGLAQFSGAGYFGQGVTVSTVKRLYSDVLANQLSLAQSQGSQLEAYYAQIEQLDSLLADASAGLSPALQDFFGGVADLAAHPESVPSRQVLIGSAQALVARFQGLGTRFDEMRTRINTEITSSVDAINGYARQITALNHNILVAESVGRQPANDLRDQRDQLIAALNQEVRATVVKENSGEYNVFIGNGQPVVVGSNAYALVATPSLEDPQRMEVGYPSGTSVAQLAPDSLQGGRLGGLLAYRSDTLDMAQNALGRVAIGLAQTFNDRHALGQDLNGALGGAFFSVPGPTVLPLSSNAGTATVAAALQSADALTTSDYRLHYDGASGGNEQFTLTRLADGTTTSITFPTGGSGSVSVDGLDLTLSTGATLNDSWIIEPTRYGARDIAMALTNPAAIAAAAPVRTGASLANAGDATISQGSVSSVADLPLPASVSLTYDAAMSQFNVAGAVPAAGPVAYTSGGTISFNGVSFTITGSPADGDVFTLERNSNAIGDNRNALALAALQSANTLGRNAAVPGSAATTTFQGAYSQLVSEVGNTSRRIQVTSAAQTNVIAQARQAQQSVSGVNLDEEAANLLRYQQAYQASAKMMEIASGLFQTLLDLGR